MMATILRSSLCLLMQVLLNYGNKSPYKAGDHIIALAAYLRSKLDLNGPILGVKQMFRPCVKQLRKIAESRRAELRQRIYMCASDGLRLFWFAQVLTVIMREELEPNKYFTIQGQFAVFCLSTFHCGTLAHKASLLHITRLKG